MLTATEFMSQCTAPNLAGALPRTTRKPELGEIVVFLDHRSEAASILEFASLLAEENGARLISVFVQPSPTVTPPQTFARGTGIQEVIENLQSELESIKGRQRARFDDVVRRHGIPWSEWRSLSRWSTEVAMQAYYADLVVIAHPEPAGQLPGPSGLAESLILSSGRPIILFPPNYTASRVRRILVGWGATREAIRAVVDALPLLARAEAVEVLIVDYERQPERHGQKPGADIARRLSALGAQVEVQRLSSGGEEVGHVLLAQAGAFGADLLVMGAYGHSTLHEWLFGGVTRTVLYEAGLPVLMSR
jgi:nucleotide-binding universal stress UspA family protein